MQLKINYCQKFTLISDSCLEGRQKTCQGEICKDDLQLPSFLLKAAKDVTCHEQVVCVAGRAHKCLIKNNDSCINKNLRLIAESAYSFTLSFFSRYLSSDLHLPGTGRPCHSKNVNSNRFYEILINCYCAFTTT